MTHLNVYLTFLMAHFQTHLKLLSLLQQLFPSQKLLSNHGSFVWTTECCHQSHGTNLSLAAQLATKHCTLCAPLSLSWTDHQLTAYASSLSQHSWESAADHLLRLISKSTYYTVCFSSLLAGYPNQHVVSLFILFPFRLVDFIIQIEVTFWRLRSRVSSSVLNSCLMI